MKQAIADFAKEWREGDRGLAKDMARAYVADNPQQFDVLKEYSRDELVVLLGDYRDAGRDEEQIVVDMWLLSEFEPQKITGAITIGTPPEGAK